MKRLLILLYSFFPLLSHALEKQKTRPELDVSTVFASLLLVVSCIFLFAYLIKKTNLLKNRSDKNALKVLEKQALSRKAQVQIIEINGQQYLLGVTEHSITLLDKLETSIPSKAPLQSNINSPFSLLLSKISKKNNEK